MSELSIYCDESGSTPLTDKAEIFLTGSAIYGGLGGRGLITPPKNKHGRHNFENTIHAAAKTRSFAVCKMIIPRPGYQTELERKIRIVRWIREEEVRREIERPGGLPPDKVQASSLIWTLCMLLMISDAVIRLVLILRSPIRTLRVFMDRRDMTDEDRAMYTHFLQHQLVPSIHHALDNPIPREAVSEEGMANARRAKELIRGMRVVIQWKGQEGWTGCLGLLSMADSLSNHIWREKKNMKPKPGFLAALAAAGRGNVPIEDLTSLLLQQDHGNWEAAHKIKVPQEVIDGTGDGSNAGQ